MSAFPKTVVCRGPRFLQEGDVGVRVSSNMGMSGSAFPKTGMGNTGKAGKIGSAGDAGNRILFALYSSALKPLSQVEYSSVSLL